MRRIGRIAGLVVLAAFFWSCEGGTESSSDTNSGEGTTTTTAIGAASTTAAASPPPTEPATDLPPSAETGKSELADGRHFGYWSTFEIGDTTAFGEFDLAYFLTGAEAEAAAAKKNESVENDYYIVNDNPKLRTLIARGNTKVRVLSSEGGATLEDSNVADFEVDRHKDAGFWVTIEGGIVTEIEEQYQP